LAAVRGEEPLGVDVAEGPDGVRLRLTGELDAYTAGALREALVDELRRERSCAIVLDCAQLDFMDGGGLKVIEWASAAADPRPIVVRNASPVMCQLAAITGLDRTVDFGLGTRPARIASAGA
jgi:anti-anti-sigma factor